MKLNKHVLYAVILTSILALVCAGAQPVQANIALKLKETRQHINTLKRKEFIEKNKLYSNQIKMEKAENELKQSQAQYHTTQNKLNSLENQLQGLNKSYLVDEFRAKNRIRQIYRKQRQGLFELILSSQDLNDLLDRVYYQNKVAKRDKKQLNNVHSKIKHIAHLRYQMEQDKQILSNSIANINYQQKTLEKAIKQNEIQISKLQTDRKAYEKAEKDLERQSKNLAAMISRTAHDASVMVKTGFIRPLSTMRITSRYGWRVHPIFKSRTFHSGVDIGAPYGTPIFASNNGKVIYSGWYGGYGKVVILDHGKINNQGISTLYAHMSSISVKVGDYVVKGQKVGNVGTTGYSTGPHLHFEVRKNGQTQNPLNYI